MKIWLIQVGEPLSLPGYNTRLYRTGLLAEVLHERSHEVVYWSTSFDHTAKRYYKRPANVMSKEGYPFRFLHGRSYLKNISVARLINHIQLARDFDRQVANESLPDIILCSMPTIEVCHRAARYAKKFGIPFFVDIRDLWPDIFAHGKGRVFRALSAGPIRMLRSQLNYSLKCATGLTAVSQGYLDWGLVSAGRKEGINDRVFHLGYGQSLADAPTLTETQIWLKTLGLRPDHIVCSFLGTFGKTYDVRTVLDAAKRLDGAGEGKFRFVLCGRGDDEEMIRAMGVKISNVIIPGWLDEKKLAALVRCSAIGLAAYSRGAPQGIPNKIGEYASGGLAVISSLNGEARRLIERYRCGAYYEAGNAEQLVEILTELGRDQLRMKSMRANARMLFREQFDGRSIYKNMADFLEKNANMKNLK